MFRNPLYLDLQLLRNVADYFDIDLPADADVTRRTVDDRTGRVGLNKGIEVGRETGSSEEVTEVYKTTLRPVRAMNDVIDALVKSSDLVDLTTNANVPINQRDLVQAEGNLSLSPITEVGALMSGVMPLLIDQAAAGRDELDLNPADIGRLFLDGAATADVVHVFTLDIGDDQPNTYVLASPAHMFGNAVIDDLDGDLTVLASVDRMIGPDSTFSLERHLLPGLNRTLRRAIGAKGLTDLLTSYGEAIGHAIDSNAISVTGPAVLLTPVAIY